MGLDVGKPGPAGELTLPHLAIAAALCLLQSRRGEVHRVLPCRWGLPRRRRRPVQAVPPARLPAMPARGGWRHAHQRHPLPHLQH